MTQRFLAGTIKPWKWLVLIIHVYPKTIWKPKKARYHLKQGVLPGMAEITMVEMKIKFQLHYDELNKVKIISVFPTKSINWIIHRVN